MWLFGWKVDPHRPEGVDRSVMVAAPHTSNWDGFFMIATGYALRLKFRFAIKKEWLGFPMGLLLKPLGAIGVDRSPQEPGGKRPSLTEALAALYEKRKDLVIVIAPEGSRGAKDRLRTGFYHTALMAGVPISLGYLDYGRKVAGVGKVIFPTGNMEADLAEIMAFYRSIKPKFPGKSMFWSEG